MKKIYPIVLCLCIISCGGGQKQTLAMEEKKTEEEKSTLSSTETLEMEEKSELRETDANNPPVILDMSGQIETNALDLANYYSKVSYIKLKHPKASEGLGFLSPDRIMIMGINDIPMATSRLQGIVSEKYILVGNLQSGLHNYDRDGVFKFSLSEMNDPPKSSKDNFLELDMAKIDNALAGFSIVDDICFYTTVDKRKASIHFFDMSTGKEEIREQLVVRQPVLLSAKNKTFIDYDYKLVDDKQSPFMYSLNAKGDTLCRFVNHNMLPVIKTSVYHNPGSSNPFHFNNMLNIKQLGNDTVYRVISENKLSPRYIFDAGKYKANIQDMMRGETKDKRAPNALKESDKLLLFNVSYHHVHFYDKTAKKIYQIGSEVVNNTLDGGLPIHYDALACSDNSIYAFYTKNMLKKTMNNKDIKMSKEQQAKINGLYNDLAEGEAILMLIE